MQLPVLPAASASPSHDSVNWVTSRDDLVRRSTEILRSAEEHGKYSRTHSPSPIKPSEIQAVTGDLSLATLVSHRRAGPLPCGPRRHFAGSSVGVSGDICPLGGECPRLGPRNREPPHKDGSKNHFSGLTASTSRPCSASTKRQSHPMLGVCERSDEAQIHGRFRKNHWY